MPPPQPAETAPLPRAEMPNTRVEAMNVMRSKIAEHMVLSKRTSPHVTTVHKVDIGPGKLVRAGAVILQSCARCGAIGHDRGRPPGRPSGASVSCKSHRGLAAPPEPNPARHLSDQSEFRLR
jgi:hypothetical protein